MNSKQIARMQSNKPSDETETELRAGEMEKPDER